MPSAPEEVFGVDILLKALCTVGGAGLGCPSSSRRAVAPEEAITARRGLREEEFFITLSAEDRIRVRLQLRHGEPVEMTVQLEAFIEEQWFPVRRYDTAHGYLHVHSAPWDDNRDRSTAVEHGGLKGAVTMAIREIKENWPRYRETCVAAFRGEAT